MGLQESFKDDFGDFLEVDVNRVTEEVFFDFTMVEPQKELWGAMSGPTIKLSQTEARKLTEFLMKSLGMAGFDTEIYNYLQDLVFYHKMELKKNKEFLSSTVKQNVLDKELKVAETVSDILERMKWNQPVKSEGSNDE